MTGPALYDMQHRHDPDAGTYGDCWRACIATVTHSSAEANMHVAVTCYGNF